MVKKLKSFLLEQKLKDSGDSHGVDSPQYQEVLVEIRLQRVRDHVLSDRTFGIISGFKDGTPLKENIAVNKRIAALARSYGFGYFWIDGVGNEDDAEGNHLPPVVETGVFVVGSSSPEDGKKMFEFLKKAAHLSNPPQTSFIFKDSGSKVIRLHGAGGEKQVEFNNTQLDKASQYFTKLRGGSHSGRPFFFYENNELTTFIHEEDSVLEKWFKSELKKRNKQ